MGHRSVCQSDYRFMHATVHGGTFTMVFSVRMNAYFNHSPTLALAQILARRWKRHLLHRAHFTSDIDNLSSITSVSYYNTSPTHISVKSIHHTCISVISDIQGFSNGPMCSLKQKPESKHALQFLHKINVSERWRVSNTNNRVSITSWFEWILCCLLGIQFRRPELYPRAGERSQRFCKISFH